MSIRKTIEKLLTYFWKSSFVEYLWRSKYEFLIIGIGTIFVYFVGGWQSYIPKIRDWGAVTGIIVLSAAAFSSVARNIWYNAKQKAQQEACNAIDQHFKETKNLITKHLDNTQNSIRTYLSQAESSNSAFESRLTHEIDYHLSNSKLTEIENRIKEQENTYNAIARAILSNRTNLQLTTSMISELEKIMISAAEQHAGGKIPILKDSRYHIKIFQLFSEENTSRFAKRLFNFTPEVLVDFIMWNKFDFSYKDGQTENNSAQEYISRVHGLASPQGGVEYIVRRLVQPVFVMPFDTYKYLRPDLEEANIDFIYPLTYASEAQAAYFYTFARGIDSQGARRMFLPKAFVENQEDAITKLAKATIQGTIKRAPYSDIGKNLLTKSAGELGVSQEIYAPMLRELRKIPWMRETSLTQGDLNAYWRDPLGGERNPIYTDFKANLPQIAKKFGFIISWWDLNEKRWVSDYVEYYPVYNERGELIDSRLEMIDEYCSSIDTEFKNDLRKRLINVEGEDPKIYGGYVPDIDKLEEICRKIKSEQVQGDSIVILQLRRFYVPCNKEFQFDFPAGVV